MGRPGNVYWNGEKKGVYEAETVRLIKMYPKMPPKERYEIIMSTFPELQGKISLKAMSHLVLGLIHKEDERELKIKDEERKAEDIKLNNQLDSLKAILINYGITEIPGKNNIEEQTKLLEQSNNELSEELNTLQSIALDPKHKIEETKINSEIQLYSKKIENMDKQIISLTKDDPKGKNATQMELEISHGDLHKKLQIIEAKHNEESRKLLHVTKKIDAFEDPKRILHYMKALLERKNAYDGKDSPQQLWEKIFQKENYGIYFFWSGVVDYNKLFRKIFVGPNSYRNKIVHEDGYVDVMRDLDGNRECCGRILDLLKELDQADMKMYDPKNKNPTATIIGFTNTEMVDRYSNLILEMKNGQDEKDKKDENDIKEKDKKEENNMEVMSGDEEMVDE